MNLGLIDSRDDVAIDEALSSKDTFPSVRNAVIMAT